MNDDLSAPTRGFRHALFRVPARNAFAYSRMIRLGKTLMRQPSGATESVIDSRIPSGIAADYGTTAPSARVGFRWPRLARLETSLRKIVAAILRHSLVSRGATRYGPGFACGASRLRRTPKELCLTADLAAFGVSTDGAAICTDLPELKTISQALGCLYVLERQHSRRPVYGSRSSRAPQSGPANRQRIFLKLWL